MQIPPKPHVLSDIEFQKDGIIVLLSVLFHQSEFIFFSPLALPPLYPFQGDEKSSEWVKAGPPG